MRGADQGEFRGRDLFGGHEHRLERADQVFAVLQPEADGVADAADVRLERRRRLAFAAMLSP